MNQVFEPGMIVRSRLRNGTDVVFLMVEAPINQTAPAPGLFRAVVLENLDPNAPDKRGSVNDRWQTENFVLSSWMELVFALDL